MRFLIDTHILLWYIIGDKRVGEDVKEIIENDLNTIYISNASLWEIAIKIAIGKLKLNISMNELKAFLSEKNFIVLNYDFEDLNTLLLLPFHHQDPFDRLIVAQAKIKSLTIITNDRQVLRYFDTEK